MAYPNQTQIENAALQFSVPPIAVFAYAAVYGAIPARQDDVQQLISRAQRLASFVQTAPAYQISSVTPNIGGAQDDLTTIILGYMQATGSIPLDFWRDVAPWAQQNGFLTSGNALTGKMPYPGYGYPPNGAPVEPSFPVQTGPVTTAPAGPDLSSLTQNPIILVGGAVLLFLLLFGKRR